MNTFHVLKDGEEFTEATSLEEAQDIGKGEARGQAVWTVEVRFPSGKARDTYRLDGADWKRVSGMFEGKSFYKQ